MMDMPPTGAKETGMDLESVKAQVGELLDAFGASCDTFKLREAANLIAAITVRNLSNPEERQKARSTKLTFWLAVLDTIDTAKDPKFDPADLPMRRVPIPDTPMKPEYLIRCAAGIADPEVRKEYDEAVVANNEKSQRYNLQTALLKIDKELTPRAEAYITGQYPKSPQNLNEVEQAMAATLHNSERVARIRSMVAPVKG
jgi:hypothetical protein